MNLTEICNLVIAKTKSNKKVTRLYDGFEDDMKYYFKVVNRINSMPRNEANIDGVPFDKIQLISAISGLVYPNSITISGASTEEDFLIRPENAEDVKIDVDRLANIVSGFYGMFKAEVPQCTVESARKDAALSNKEFSERCSFNGMVTRDTITDLPVPCSIQIYRKRLYVYDDMDVVAEWLTNKFRDIGQSKK